MVARVEHRRLHPSQLEAADNWPGKRGTVLRRGEAIAQHREAARVGQIQSLRIAPHWLEQVARQRDARMRLVWQPRQLGDRVSDDLVDRLALVDDAVDE